MAAEMTNIDIREFTTLSGTDGEDSVLLVQESGANGKIKIALFKQLLTSHVIPSIVEGTWWIDDAPTGVTAIGKTPLLRRGKLGVEYKYDTDDNTMWRLLINYDDIVLRYQDLTEMQRHELSGKNAYLRKEKDYIQWSLGKDGMYDGWQNLIPLLDIKGNKGDPALFPATVTLYRQTIQKAVGKTCITYATMPEPWSSRWNWETARIWPFLKSC